MVNLYAYRKLFTLKNGKKVLVRLFNERDREPLLKILRETSLADNETSKEDMKNSQMVDGWLTPENSVKVLTLVAMDLGTNQLIGSVTLLRGKQAALRVGEIQHIFVSRPFQGLGLGSILLDELLELTSQAGIHWLKAEVPAEQTNIIKAFQARDFEIKATLEDFFIGKNGAPYDVALMVRPLRRRVCEDY